MASVSKGSHLFPLSVTDALSSAYLFDRVTLQPTGYCVDLSATNGANSYNLAVAYHQRSSGKLGSGPVQCDPTSQLA